MVPGNSNRARKLHRNHSLIVVGLFELPATLPSNYMHWCDIRWYRVLVVDTQMGHVGPVLIRCGRSQVVSVRSAPSCRLDLSRFELYAASARCAASS